MSISRYNIVAAVIFLGALQLADAVVELPQAEATVSDKRTHAMQLGERQSLPVMRLAAFSIELVWMGC